MPETRLPHCLLEGLVRAFMANGTFGRMAEDAISWAAAKGYRDKVELYRNVRDQVGDYWADMQK